MLPIQMVVRDSGTGESIRPLTLLSQYLMDGIEPAPGLLVADPNAHYSV